MDNNGNNNMHEKISNITRLCYIIIAILLFFLGLILMIFFFLIITILFGLAAWAWSGIFVYLAITGRPYRDFSATLKYPFSAEHKAKRGRYRINMANIAGSFQAIEDNISVDCMHR